MKKISVVIRTYNEEKYIAETLRSIRNQECEQFHIEIVLVDNRSTDQTVKIAKEYIDKLVYIEKDEFTWGKALNMGIEKATGEYILLTSGHCILVSGSLYKALKFAESNRLAAVYGGQIGDPKKDKIECLELFDTYPENYNQVCLKNEHCCGISNAACFLQKDVWINHRFDEKLLSAEDGEWASRIQNAGYTIGYCSDFKIIHGHDYNPSYIEKKWFFRILEVDKNRKKKDLLFRSSGLFFMYRIVRLFIRYKIMAKQHEIMLKTSDLFKYVLICERAKKNSRKCLFYGNSEYEKYMIL